VVFVPRKITGAYVIEPDKIEDPRGFLARVFCKKEFEAHGLNPEMVQCNISFTLQKGTLRGMHYQTAPRQEAKLVRCSRGSIYDVLLDLRPQSPTFRQWEAITLTAENCRMAYIPAGVAHGFQTLIDATEVFYQMSEFYAGSCAQGVRWDDPAFAIDWPIENPVLSDRDRSQPLWS
jgi:dTDP-4-dehydrorhamnose 3,5-epimerase